MSFHLQAKSEVCTRVLESEPPIAAGCKCARPEGDGGNCGSGRQKKACVSYEHLILKKISQVGRRKD